MARPTRLARVQPALALAARERTRAVPLQELAHAAGLSTFHFQRLFSQVAGESPKALSLRLRLEHAAAALARGNTSVLEIAIDSGFESHEAFTRAFRGYFSITPAAYRKRGLAGDAKQHAAAVESIGPCVRLYRFTQINELKGATTMSYIVEKRDLVPQPVVLASKRIKRADIAATIGGLLPHVFKYTQKHGLALVPSHPLTRYSDAGPGLITIEPGMRIAAAPATVPAPEDNVRFDTLPGGPAAVTMHTGPYDTLHKAYEAVEEWMAAQNLAPAGDPWESYVTDPGQEPDPNKWQTEVFWPIRGK